MHTTTHTNTCDTTTMGALSLFLAGVVILSGMIAYAYTIGRADAERAAIYACTVSMADTEGVEATPREVYDLYASHCAGIITL